MLTAISKKNQQLMLFFDQIDLRSRNFAIARSLLAIGTLSTLLFNKADYLFFPHTSVALATGGPYLKNISLFSLFNPSYVIASQSIAIVILIVVLSGFYPRFSAVLHWWVSYSFFCSSNVVDGGDQVSVILTFLLIPIYLFDNRKSHWESITNNKGSFGFYFSRLALIAIRLQMCALYFQAAVAKLAVEEWKNGTALYYWFMRHDFGRPEYLANIIDPLLKNSLILPLVTWAVLIFEFLLFMSINFKQVTRNKLFILGILFHFMIFIIHGLFSFFMAMSAGLLIYSMPLTQNNLKTDNKWTSY